MGGKIPMDGFLNGSDYAIVESIDEDFLIVKRQNRGGKPYFTLHRKKKFLWFWWWSSRVIQWSIDSPYSLHKYIDRWKDWPPQDNKQ